MSIEFLHKIQLFINLQRKTFQKSMSDSYGGNNNVDCSSVNLQRFLMEWDEVFCTLCFTGTPIDRVVS